MFKDIFIGILIIWNLITFYLCSKCGGCKNEHDVKLVQESEENIFKRYLEKESECECLKETIRSLKFQITQLQKQVEIKDEIIKKGDTVAKR